jgi:general nucleoside transport system permease protein
VNPVEVWVLLFKGAFGDWFSWQNTLQRAAPLMLTALCVAHAGACRADGHRRRGRAGAGRAGLCGAALRGAAAGRHAGTVAVCWRRSRGGRPGSRWPAVLRQYRGVNETISSLLLAYIAIGAVQAPRRRPAARPGQPEQALDAAAGREPAASAPSAATTCTGAWSSVSWLCVVAGLWLGSRTHGFAVRVVGGNPRAAQLVGLPARRLIVWPARSAARRPGWPAASRWRRCTRRPTRR